MKTAICEIADVLPKGCPRETPCTSVKEGDGVATCPYYKKVDNTEREPTHRIVNIHRNARRSGIICAYLEDINTGEVAISATLDYILDAIEKRGYIVEEVSK